MMDDSTARAAPTALVAGDEAVLVGAIREVLVKDGARLVDWGAGADAGLDIYVHVAGVEPEASFEGQHALAYADGLSRALGETYFGLQRAVAAIRAKGGGGSAVVVAAGGDGRAFEALRQGLRLLVKSAALELGAEGVRVNIVLPGTGANPLGSPVTPADIAASVAFVASGRAHFMTGADLVVDGGRLAR